MRYKYFLFFVFCFFISCNLDEHRGIKIGADLYENRTIKENTKLKHIIDEILDKKESGFIKIIEFDCGGGAGCYDLGYILSQTISKLGEDDFISITKKLNHNQRQQIISLLDVGFEYGDNNYDGIRDNTTLEEEYPELSKSLRQR